MITDGRNEKMRAREGVAFVTRAVASPLQVFPLAPCFYTLCVNFRLVCFFLPGFPFSDCIFTPVHFLFILLCLSPVTQTVSYKPTLLIATLWKLS